MKNHELERQEMNVKKENIQTESWQKQATGEINEAITERDDNKKQNQHQIGVNTGLKIAREMHKEKTILSQAGNAFSMLSLST